MSARRPNILFICSRNEWRSRTAETLWRNDDRISVRSAGTSPRARVRINRNLTDWADTIFVMEDRHQQQLIERFGRQGLDGKIVVLDIADIYSYMDPELVSELRDALAPYLG
ncbi:low molecular weight protein tyrosine phosphatase family protein [Lewinella sp. IMCC34191]|uniref:low molecular weight protein tyrosine phosphatase family protein n=1 Tax=Lewinella sp. IMCC34191 TaxID=2259172 RepID=UPI000E22F579|nr:protein tyrosine phosphatase [Lewinella sp. IMCC34191]